MPSLGIGELLLLGVIILVFVGPERLPHATRQLGRLYARMRRAADELRRALVLEADRLDEEDRIRELRKKRLEEEKARQDAEEAGEVVLTQPDKVEPELEDEPAPSDDPPPMQGLFPPGFTADEWNELPEHVRNIILRRKGEA